MNRSRWSSLALATSLVFGAGCCCHTSESCRIGRPGAVASGYAPNPCECGSVNGAMVAGGPTLPHGAVYQGEGPVLTTPEMYNPGVNPGINNPPRIVPVPQANPIPYTP